MSKYLVNAVCVLRYHSIQARNKQDNEEFPSNEKEHSSNNKGKVHLQSICLQIIEVEKGRFFFNFVILKYEICSLEGNRRTFLCTKKHFLVTSNVSKIMLCKYGHKASI